MKDFTLKSKAPGSLQADTVAHCGTSLSGQFVWTLTVTDEYSGWTENEAVYGKIGTTVGAALFTILNRLPFTPSQINTDNGTEFMNETVQNYIETVKDVKFTRSQSFL